MESSSFPRAKSGARSTSVECNGKDSLQNKEDDKQQGGQEDEEYVELEEKQRGEEDGQQEVKPSVKKQCKQEDWQWQRVMKRVARGALIGAVVVGGVALLTSPPVLAATGLAGTGTVVKAHAVKAIASAGLAVMKDVLQPLAEQALRVH